MGDEVAARIVAVESDANMRQLLRLHLSHVGYEVRAAEDAIVAGRMVLEDPPDLLIVAAELPYLDGFEFVALLRGEESVPPIPVVFLAASEEAKDRAAQLRAPCLTKPLYAPSLLAAVAAQLPRKAA